MKVSLLGLLALTALTTPFVSTHAAPNAVVEGLKPHKAVYNINMIATHSGSQVVGISGKMSYELHKKCDAWITNHQFTLLYSYAEGPGMRIESDFTTYEASDGSGLNFASRRTRDGTPYQELRGVASMGKGKGDGKASYNAPKGLSYDLKAGTLFPVAHTTKLAQHAREGKTFYPAIVFDGSDEDGPLEISSFIGSKANPTVVRSDAIDGGLLKSPAWNVRMAVFNDAQDEEESDYEMDMVFHENGIISGMKIEYDDFSVKQTLVSLEEISADSCASAASAPTKP